MSWCQIAWPEMPARPSLFIKRVPAARAVRPFADHHRRADGAAAGASSPMSSSSAIWTPPRGAGARRRRRRGSLLVALEDNYPPARNANGLRALAARELRYRITFPAGPERAAAHGRRIAAPSTRRWTTSSPSSIGADAALPAPRASATISTSGWRCRTACWQCWCRATASPSRAPDIFILWMVGSALILMAIAILFLRNQVRPIERLARAADSFGKGRAVPDFKPYGATEVRRAAQAFITMRERIERHVQQRTEMLAGVSHDLKTPLTRMKLALAMMPTPTPTSHAMRADIAEMEHMLDEYLAFARGEGGEESQLTDLGELVRDTAAAAAHGAPARTADRRRARQSSRVSVKRAALRRCTHQSDGQCPEAWQHGGGAAAARRALRGDRGGRRRPRHSRRRGAKKPSGPFTAWMRAAICKAAARPGPGHRPRHRPRPWRRSFAGQEPGGRTARGRPIAGLTYAIFRSG